jgi:membrane-associated phospholipid phosphatase
METRHIHETVHSLRQKPLHVRENIALGVAGGITAIVAVGWFAATAVSGTFSLAHAPDVYKKFIATFLFSFILLVGGWMAFPALTPLDRYIENGYKLPIAHDISLAIASYTPPEGIKVVWKKWISPHQNGEREIPVTSIPSAHIVWIIILGAYLFQFKKILFWIFLPFLFLSALGTLLFTMHYFADVLAGICIGVLSILFVSKLSQKQG